ncbi:hypothetical protein ANN_26368 [Periplaneta americana]|uniref:Uncharacterized protein n=1 Tax=Periplaneta americana TaxID=6978 RepID=A0ABQ8RYF7_PERAM|nr:hypothetical protein ANN_26368 [Periplaneta americana]
MPHAAGHRDLQRAGRPQLRRQVQDLRTGRLPRHRKAVSGVHSQERCEDPKTWLLDRSFEWHYLAADFTQYFRMMLVHQRQFKFTPMDLAPWAEQMFVLIAHLLHLM